MPADPALPAPPPGEAKALLRAEIARAHALMMGTAGLANALLDQGAMSPGPQSRADLAAAGLAGLAARLMRRVSEGIRALLRAEGVAPVPVQAPARATSRPGPRYYAASGLARGRLNNGNPAGDYLAAPRCGARARSGSPCRQPAMRNGRCRFHGGKSTGARTHRGLARCRTARLVHGARSRGLLELRSRACQSARRLGALARALRIPAGHGVDGSDSGSPRLLPPPGGVPCDP